MPKIWFCEEKSCFSIWKSLVFAFIEVLQLKLIFFAFIEVLQLKLIFLAVPARNASNHLISQLTSLTKHTLFTTYIMFKLIVTHINGHIVLSLSVIIR